MRLKVISQSDDKLTHTVLVVSRLGEDVLVDYVLVPYPYVQIGDKFDVTERDGRHSFAGWSKA